MSAQLPKVPGGLLPQTSTRLPLWIALGLGLLMAPHRATSSCRRSFRKCPEDCCPRRPHASRSGLRWASPC
ncbi:hypothetical protein TC41_0189 [Alicyclobacillus acidocaldarius subsp. acidocaldarius Tc-4-1]|uniref:Uncharacterized protein n=1 Tax=Alicyclobacillus acidocaldarius (strain Tc-4-1) TaxID=1048834 RepID=F8IJ16_ALIAT|nr:hypothetical protein TC41_0189 [Alicyclobacillus acidocaldarius subsp. acidocaldarius Tc-4-1]